MRSLFASIPTAGLRRMLACLASTMAVGVADAGFKVAESADTVQSRFVEAAEGLLDSSPDATSPLMQPRAMGHLARLRGEIDAVSLRLITPGRPRLVWLEAAMADRGLAPGSSIEQARAATAAALELLAAVDPDDPAVRLDRIVGEITADQRDGVELSSLMANDLAHRPFVASPDAICDRLARSRGVPAAVAMLDLADAAALPPVVAAVLAAGLDADPAVMERLDRLDHGSTGIGPTVIFELARRGAGDAVARYATAHPEAVALPGVRTAAIAAAAIDDPDAAIALAGSVEVLDRLPGAGRTAVRTGLARGLVGTDPDAAWDHANEAGQLDDRIIAHLASRPPDQDPGRMLDDVRSLRTVAAGRLVGDLSEGRVERATIIESLADLYRSGRYDLAYSLLIPNTTEVRRPADQWLPTRIDLLATALARADASPDAFIPLLESVARIHGVDAQIEAFAAIAGNLARLDAEADLPEPLRAVLADVLVAIALRG